MQEIILIFHLGTTNFIWFRTKRQIYGSKNLSTKTKQFSTTSVLDRRSANLGARLLGDLFVDEDDGRLKDDLVVDAHAGDQEGKSQDVEAVEDLPADNQREEPDEEGTNLWGK